ncbi:MAG: hypothetical protein Hens3KO_22090 [Henriciella sp.]
MRVYLAISVCVFAIGACFSPYALMAETEDEMLMFSAYAPVFSYNPKTTCPGGADKDYIAPICAENKCAVMIGVSPIHQDNAKNKVLGGVPFYVDIAEGAPAVFDGESTLCVEDEDDLYCYTWDGLLRSEDLCLKLENILEQGVGR